MVEKILILILWLLLSTILLFIVFNFYYNLKKTKRSIVSNKVHEDKNIDINNIDINEYIERVLTKEGYNLDIVDAGNFKMNIYKYQSFNTLKLKIMVKLKEFTYPMKEELINEIDCYLKQYHNIDKKYVTTIILPESETKDFINFLTEGTMQSFMTRYNFTAKFYAGICIKTKKIYFGINHKSSPLIIKYLQLKRDFKELIEPFSDVYEMINY